MDEKKEIVVTLKDGTKVTGQMNSAGNIICEEKLDKAIFSRENLSEIVIEEDGYIANLTNYALRTFYYENGGTFIRLDAMNEIELLQAENDTLREENETLAEAIAELAEIIGGDE